MKNLLAEKPRFTSRQKKAMVLTGALPVTVVLIMWEVFKLILRLAWKFRTAIRRTVVTTAVVFFLTAFFMPMVNAPKADASKPYTEAVATPTPSELENIVAYIARVFEPEGKAVVVKAIECFYSESGLRPNAVGQNSDGPKSKDHGVAQLNDYWHKLSDAEKTEYKANIDRAYEIYKNNGNTFNPWYGRGCK